MNERKKAKLMFSIDENNEILSTKLVPPLKLCSSPRVSDSPNEASSMSYRMKRRNQVHRSLDFNMMSGQILTPRVIKADHTILPTSTPKALTCRKAGFGSTVTVNNRRIAKNLFLDSFPM
ncbi:hypothetical protein SteCoe_34091 [Stentor coeruleus]|uniref:Uncharacterized protein n=1 Tax=Stentor coeruleus TaxID=5963 RepID=A0A1R2AVA5_9CILI|nr:hypothetical protein SteCoe_34091 [Stentor coeruleus]